MKLNPTNRWRWAGAAAVAVLLGACGTPTPPTRFHSLTPAPTAAPPAQAVSAAGQLAWELLPVSMPAGIDQPQWVLRVADGSLLMLEQERWIGPPAIELRDAVAARLVQLLGAPAAAGADRWRIAIDVQRFELAPGREARLEVTWSLATQTAPATALRCRGSFAQPVAANEGYLELARAQQTGVARLADAIAKTLQRAAAGLAPACEG